MKQISQIVMMAATVMLLFTACKKDKTTEEETPTVARKYVLIIENGAQSMQPEATSTYNAFLVDASGNVTPATGITWSVGSTSVATITSAGLLTGVGTGTTIITASVTVDGNTYTASVPVAISIPSIFAVAPSAIIYEKGGSLQLETVYFSPTGGNPNYTFTSSNSGVASVSSTGLVNFVNTGECTITVSADLNGNPQVIVPVLVIGIPDVVLPVTRVDVTPASADLFRNETQQLTAKAYKSDNSEVTGKTFTWTSLDPTIATVSTTGMVTPVAPGTAYIQAFTDGIIGQAEIIVNPDTLVWITPFNTSIPANGSKQFVASAYRLTRTTSTPLTGITFHWEIPTYGIDIFDIATVTQTGLVSMKSNAMAGMMTFVTAWDQAHPNNGSVATIMVAIADDCDCGAGNSDVASINVSNGNTINMTMMDTPLQLNVTALNSTGGTVANPALVFCSDNIMVASVDSEGLIIPAGEGTATIKICSGSYAEKTITVNVTLF
ncbi:MAG: hypothetical protein CVU05_13375 [Bacteroidetes bacterium HGW-Bacteroidetes-21]|jgi:hypothetical protein|nr:MAG: hypothetical protein CVU05_13375 [Bacteroidetes bacterium HGW-Bacteroidetes-21]